MSTQGNNYHMPASPQPTFIPVTASVAGFSLHPPAQSNIISIHNEKQLIVTLENDGTVVWANGTIDVDSAASAAKAFGEVLRYGAVEPHGITKRVRDEMYAKGWDAAFDQMTRLAQDTGALSESDLTYERDCCTIVNKLNSIKE